MSVESGARPRVPRLQRRLMKGAKALTFPFLPDDYLALINPMWSARELQGTIVELRPETERATTVVIRPSFRWPGHRAGQYVRIGVEHTGVRHWRAYTLTSDSPHPDGLISISVRRVDGGRVSSFLNEEARPGMTVTLGAVEGTFCLPERAGSPLLMISAGSGVTPIFAMLRELVRDGADTDVVHIHSERDAEDVMFAGQFESLGSLLPGYRRVERLSSADGRLTPADLDRLCPDWRQRDTFLSGPPEMLTDFSAHFEAENCRERLSLEHFQPFAGDGGAGGLGQGGRVRFRGRDVTAEADGSTPILVAGESAGVPLSYGCRMGICHTCDCKLVSGRLRDLRTGEVFGQPGQMARICVSAPEGDVELEEGHIVIDGTAPRSKA
ncbi:MAG: ferredoxin reductase [Streptosporangiales bacterium]|nr:ferredoxin reductase [Streptosporangiales bacterium]